MANKLDDLWNPIASIPTVSTSLTIQMIKNYHDKVKCMEINEYQKGNF